MRTRPRYYNDHTPTASLSPVLNMYANFRRYSAFLLRYGKHAHCHHESTLASALVVANDIWRGLERDVQSLNVWSEVLVGSICLPKDTGYRIILFDQLIQYSVHRHVQIVIVCGSLGEPRLDNLLAQSRGPWQRIAMHRAQRGTTNGWHWSSLIQKAWGYFSEFNCGCNWRIGFKLGF